MDDVKRFECPDGFAVESKNEDEVMKMAKMHAREMDKMEKVSDEDIKSHMKTM